MNREDLVIFLNDLLQRRQITAGEAAALLARFDAGDLPANLMPDPEADRAPDQSTWLAALLFVLLLVGGNANQRLTRAQRTRARDLLRLRFQADVIQTATLYTSGRLAVAVWQRSMQASITTYSLRMASAGAGTLPSAIVQTRVADMLLAQRVFLRRFAVQLAAKELSGRAMSQAALNARSQMYGGSGIESFWVGNESAEVPGGDVGVVVDFLPLDDPNTCLPCSNAGRNGPYLVGAHPWPGADICQGMGRCRCELRYRHDMAAWESLSGAMAA